MSSARTVEQPAQLLAFLFAVHPEVKKTKVRKWLKHGCVLVNGCAVTKYDHFLRKGDTVSIRSMDESLAAGLLPPDLPVAFEDDCLIVIEKPPDLLSIATETEREQTAYAFLTDYVRCGNPRGDARVWIVHRLDRETSGLMVLAKTEAAKRELQANWETTQKRYLAIVEGLPPSDRDTISSHLDENGPFKVYSARPSNRTRLAVTRYRVIKRTKTGALVELAPETGRRNQIRVHLADMGCPIVGDRKYSAQTNPARRVALHSSGLQFKHPVTGKVLRFESPLPEELARLLRGAVNVTAS